MSGRRQDEAMMGAALRLAAHSPRGDRNPRVGAVVTDRDGSIVGRGWHRGAGTPHAEVMALADAGDKAAGGTAYITLEPCAHTGRTGPCTQALLDAGIDRVVFAQTDPNPVAGGGETVLRSSGRQVTGGVLADRALALNREWSWSMVHGVPWVTWKCAATLDGRTAATDGTSRWITGDAARADVHRLRAEVGCVLVGTGTALADDPALTVRDADGRPRGRQPVRAVMGCRDLPAGARVLDATAPTLLLRTHDVDQALKTLRQHGIHHVLLEGGARLAAAFWRAGAVQEVRAYLAPALLGAGTSVLAPIGIQHIGDAIRLRPARLRRLGDDIAMTLTTVGED